VIYDEVGLIRYLTLWRGIVFRLGAIEDRGCLTGRDQPSDGHFEQRRGQREPEEVADEDDMGFALPLRMV
jgi:hypothetical protein